MDRCARYRPVERASAREPSSRAEKRSPEKWSATDLAERLLIAHSWHSSCSIADATDDEVHRRRLRFGGEFGRQENGGTDCREHHVNGQRPDDRTATGFAPELVGECLKA